MNTCSAEIVALIFEFACDDVNGQTARKLGLVCKYFREIAEPIEFRTLSISGLERLKSASARLAKAITHPRKIRIEHLFICDYLEKHALWSDTLDDSRESGPGLACSRMQTFQGASVASRYCDENAEFWSLAARLVFLASSSVRTLFLISFCESSYKKCNPAAFVYEDGVLVALRGMDFPFLRTLTLKHAPEVDMTLSARTHRRWKYPVAPRLETLHLISHCRINVRQDGYVDYHPLLIGMHKWHPQLRRVVISSSEFQDVSALFNAICKLEGHKEVWCTTTDPSEDEMTERRFVKTCLNRRILPGNLKSVQVHIGRNLAEAHLQGAESAIFRSRITDFQNSVINHNIKGLVAVSPTPPFPRDGQREYEVLLSSWAGHVNDV